MLNLLTEPLIRYDTGGERTAASLPEVYAALMADEVNAFPALRPHQRHAWHAFLAQLGTLALHRSQVATPPANAVEWTTLFRALTSDFPGDEPWHLVVNDITVPAFMQSPTSTKDRERDYKNSVATPDELDMLVTSKNHDLKSSVGVQSSTDDWVFALITLQTMEGFAGAGNYGVSRMNGGLGNRPAFSLAPSNGGAGAHVRRDIGALLEHRKPPQTDDGLMLLWTIPWDGTQAEALTLNLLDPLYIEVCRPVRLCLNAARRLKGIRATSKAARISIGELQGRTGDPWTPFNSKREGLPLTLGKGGFTYRRVADYLTSGDWDRPALLRPTRDEERRNNGMRLVARATVRGQGKTEGHHERGIDIGHKVITAMQRRTGVVELGDISKVRIDQVGTVQSILSHAIQVFAARGAEERVSSKHRGLARPWLNRLDELVDARFFEELQIEFEAEEGQRQGHRNRWLMNGNNGVVDHARALLHDAEDTLPVPVIHRYKAQVNSEDLFERRLRANKGLPFLFDQASKEAD